MYLNYYCFVLVLVTVSASYFDQELPLYLSDDILISQYPSISKRSILGDAKIGSEKQVKPVEKEDGKNNEKEIGNEEESGLVFLPSFGRRTRRSISENEKSSDRIFKRDTSYEEKTKHLTGQKSNQKNVDDEIENEEESGLVFIPSFGRRTRRSIAKHQNEDLLNSESNIVFLPSFKRNGFRRTRRDVDDTYYHHYTKRSAETLNEDDNRKKTAAVTERNEELTNSDAVNGQESGLVFLPSFGRRARRSVTESRTTPSTVNKDTKTNCEEINPQITAIKTKREVNNENSEKKKSKVNDFDENKDDELEEESGLVFIPSFGRRHRRDTSSVNSSEKPKKDSNVPSIQKEEKQPKKTLATQESGLVFLPSFNRRTRRNVPSEEQNKSKDKLEDSNEKHDEEEEESGLVFLPSFGRRT